jgi:L-aspartate oxidase
LQTAHSLPPASDPSIVRAILAQGLGVLRDRDTISRAIRSLYPLAGSRGAASDPAMVGMMIAVSAYRREESRGGHYRSDFPATSPLAVPSSITLAEAFGAARDMVESQTASAGSARP